MALRLIPHVHRAAHRIALHIQRLAGRPVTQAEAHVLAHLVEAGDATVAEVHRAFGHRRSTLTSILDRLEVRGLIVRHTDARDRRTFVLSLTREGRALARRITSHLEKFEAEILAHTSARDLQAVKRVLEAVEAAVD
jgi:DNA-binding MarR family transcriptional regulator